MVESSTKMVESSGDSSEETTLDLRSVRTATEGLFGPIICRVVHIFSEQDFPWKFLYETYSHRFPNKKSCLSSRRMGTGCHPSSSTVMAYRFMIFLLDGSVDSPVGVTAFDELSVLVKMYASDFHEKSSVDQLDIIAKCSVAFPRVKVWIRVRGDSLLLHWLSWFPPESSFSKQKQRTPGSTSRRSVTSGKRQVTFEEFNDMKRTLSEVYEMITSQPGARIGSPVISRKTQAENTKVGNTQSHSVSMLGSSSNLGSLFCTMDRKQLQSLCKNYKIPANRSNAYMVEALESRLKKTKDHVEEG